MLEALIETPERQGPLTIFPVVGPRCPTLEYLLSTEIDGTDVLTIRERGDAATPMILARNNSFHDLLVLSGEPLPGESPNRLVSRSFILGGKSVTQIPASSIERGGWIRPGQEETVTEWAERFPPHPQQVGLLAFHGRRLLGLELLGSGEIYQRLHRRILVRFIKEALVLETSPPDAETLRETSILGEDARALVGSIEDAERTETRRVGLGGYWELSGDVRGGELIHAGHLVHLSVGGPWEADGLTAGKGE